jgi:SAM-dependent methyltransferase
MSSFYEKHILPHAIDWVCGLPSFEQGRKLLVPQAAGRVLEIGMGTGRNLPYYQASQLQCLCGIDPGLHPKAERRARVAGIEVQGIPLSAERIPADNHSFDCVVSTFTLCTIPDAATALKELHRVLAPGGQLLFLEHGAAPDAPVRRWQDRLTPPWRRAAGGCHLNREIPQLIEAAGFKVRELHENYQPGPRFLTYLYRGSATRQ